MGIERKIARDTSFKKAKLAKTKGRREELEAERRIAESMNGRRRNDLLPELAVSMVPTGDLHPSSRKVRSVNAQHVSRIAMAIADFGFTVPMLVRGTEIIDGHVRHAAAIKLGLEHVPVIDCAHLSEAEARKLRLAVNRLAELGQWDLDELRIELSELIDLDLDLENIGFTAQEQDIILLDPLDAETGSGTGDEPGDPPEIPVTRPGDCWVLREHRIVCGNSLGEETYAALLEGEQAHLVLTDPPYNVPIGGNVSGLGKKVHGEFAMASGELNEREWISFLETTMAQLKANVADGSIIFAFMDWRSIHLLVAAGLSNGLNLYNIVIWNKQSGSLGAGYRSQHEMIAVFCKGEHPRINNIMLGKHGRDRTNVWSMPGANRRGSSANEMLHAHATPKPVPLCIDAILDFTNRGEVVLDAFLGSGTTLIAAERCGRVCCGIELDPRFVDVSVKRWETLTGEHAVLASTGQTFDEVSETRSAGLNEEPGAEGTCHD